MLSSPQPAGAFQMPPDPGQAGTLDDLVERLRLLKVWAGAPSYEWIKERVNAAWTEAGRPACDLVGKTTVVDCFRPGRRRLNTDLVVAVVQALHPDVGYVTQWRQALRVIVGETQAASQIRVLDRLPQDLAGFTGRTAELDRLRQALRNGGAAVISAIAGMAGVGKTQLAIRAAHALVEEKPFDRVLFVNLRGFHPDPAQPPADPAAVLDGFLRLLGASGQQIPHDLPARTAAYRARLTGTRTLVVLDNAADAEQAMPLLPETEGCPVLVTSRRHLTALRPTTHLTVDVFSPDDAVDFLTRAAPEVPTGEDPDAAARIARRSGYLPLALGLVAGHIRGTPGWTLTDHADRLDERHDDLRLDTGVELALDLSYQHLPGDQQRLLRLAGLHPGQDFDAHAAAALADTDLSVARATLHHLCRDHLLQQATPGRYTLHDLVRAYAAGRAGDEDPPPQRRAALTRLFDYYVGTAATAMDTLFPAEDHHRPRVPPPGTPTPALTDLDTARAWLDTERPTLVAVAAHTAAHGWPTHTTRLSGTLFRYLDGGHHSDALIVHTHAHDAAQHIGDPTEQANALTNLGVVHLWLGRREQAVDHLQQALTLFRRADDPIGQARPLAYLGVVEERLGRCGPATDHLYEALALFRQNGDPICQARVLDRLGVLAARSGRHRLAIDHLEEALTLFRKVGDRSGEAGVLNSLGHIEGQLGRCGPATDHLHQALTLFRQVGHRTGEAWTLDHLGALHIRLGQPSQAVERYQQAVIILRETGQPDSEAWSLNGLGEASLAAGRPTDAVTHHTAAHTIAVDIGAPDQQARAHTGLGHAYHALGNPARARHHHHQALILNTGLGVLGPGTHVEAQPTGENR